MNQVSLGGKLTGIRKRWTPDGSFAVVAELIIARPVLGVARAGNQDTQPVPLRATGKTAEQMSGLEGRSVAVQGVLRRRYYNRDNQPQWGQLEIWVEQCHPTQVQEDEHG